MSAINISAGKNPNLPYSHKYSLRRNLGLPHPKPYVSHGRYIAPAPSPDKSLSTLDSTTPTTHQFYEYHRDLRKKIESRQRMPLHPVLFHVSDRLLAQLHINIRQTSGDIRLLDRIVQILAI